MAIQFNSSMKKIAGLFVFTIALHASTYAGSSDSLVSATKQEYEAGSKEFSLVKDGKVEKKNNTLRIGSCKALVDNEANDNFYEFDYCGDVDSNLTLKVIRKTLYNGEEFIILNTKSCEVYNLLGKPHLFESLIINFNESETTDRKKIIQVWKIESGKLYHIKSIPFKENLVFTDIRVDGGNGIFLKDDKERFWKASL